MPDDYVDEIMEEMEGIEGDEYDDDEDDDEEDDEIGQLVEIGALTEVGARRLRRALRRKRRRKKRSGIWGKASPPFGRSARDVQRRAPSGFIEDGTGANFFSLAAAIGATTTMRSKVSRAANVDRLLIIPSAPGAVIASILVGDEEQALATGAPVELYSPAALTDTLPDDFSPIGPALDLVVVLRNTTAVAITGTMGFKAQVKR